MDKEKADMIILYDRGWSDEVETTLMVIQFGCLLIRWQNCFREIVV